MIRLLSLTLLFLVFAFAACEKDKLSITESTELNLFGELAPATISAYGQLTDDAGNPVADAKVEAGDVSTTTDIQGLWRIENAKVKATFGYITFESAGHLHGSRTVYAREGSLYEVNVELLRRDQSFSVDAASGGTVTLPGSEATVAFRAGAFAKTDGTPITSGSVKVIAHYLDPNDTRTYDRMPGDLRGVSLTADGTPGRDITLLTSYGMMAVELVTDDGTEAKLADGQKATLTMPLAGRAAATAPTSIPMWYFNEAAGIWVEDGLATRQGDAYVGTVSHFTFWNCDVPNDFVELCGNVGFEAVGTETAPRTTPLQVRITSTRFGTRTTFVDAKGNFCGAVPKGETLALEVIGDCGEVVFSKSVGPFAEKTLLSPVSVPTSGARVIKVTGRVVCAGEVPSGATLVIILENGSSVFSSTAPDGTFSTVVLACSPSTARFKIISTASNSGSPTIPFQLDSDVDFGSVDICTEQLDTYISLISDGDVIYFSESLRSILLQDGNRFLSSDAKIPLDGAGLSVQFYSSVLNNPSGTYTISGTNGQSQVGLGSSFNRLEIYFLDGLPIELLREGDPIKVTGSIVADDVPVRLGDSTTRRSIDLKFSYFEK